MIGKKDNQNSFFDDYVYGNLLPKEHILIDIKERIDFSFIEEETKDLYSDRMGRPAYPAEIMFKMLFLEYYYNHSDVEIAVKCKHDVLYRYFVGLKIDGEIPDDTSLVVFRKRLGAERFERIFNKIVKRCKEAGLLEGRRKIVDASKIVADVAIPNTVNLLRQGRRVILKRMVKEDRKKVRELAKKYYTKEKTYQKPAEEELKEEVEKSKRLIEEVDKRYSNKVQRSIEALKKVIVGNKKDRIVSFSDTDARFG